MIFDIIIWAALGVFALIGLIIGLVKGFNKVSTWASDYAISATITIGVAAILKINGVAAKTAGIITLLLSAVTLILFVCLSRIMQKAIDRGMQKREDDLRSYGGLGVFNRIWGGLTLAIKGFVICAAILITCFFILDVAQLQRIWEGASRLYTSVLGGGLWQNVKKVAADLLVIGIINLAIRQGFAKGIFTSLWGLLVLGLAVGGCALSYALVFKSGMFDSASAALGAKLFEKISASNIPQFTAELAENVARWIITVGLSLVLIIIVAVLSALISRVIDFARFGSAFYFADGILGGAVGFIIAVALMLFLGAVFQPISDLPFMETFTSFFEYSSVAKFFYSDNLLIAFGMKELIPLRSWLT